MDDNLIDVNFDSLLELEYSDVLERAVTNCPEARHGETLTYDEHHVLLVSAFIAREFLRVLHFPELMKGEMEEHTLLFVAHWEELLRENIITPRTPGYVDGGRTRKVPTDQYLSEVIKEVTFEGYVHPNTYPLLLHRGGLPYVPSWHALRWAKKAVRELRRRIREREEGMKDV